MIKIHPLRTRLLLTIVIVLWSVAWVTLRTEANALKPTPEEAANSVFALVNEWRIAEGAPPLEINPVLVKMALDQANSLLPRFETITTYRGYHEDIQGRNQFKRAFEVYEWPNYSLPERIEVGENVAQFDIKGALNFWKNSDVHHRTAVNKTYREAGIAALAYPKGGYLFVMTFGARPKVIPALINPTAAQIFLTRENSKYSADGKADPTVQIFDEAKNPLAAEGPWQATVAIPATAGARFYVRLKYPKSEVWSLVDRARDVAIIPNSPMTVSDQLAKLLAGTGANTSGGNTQNPTQAVVASVPTATNAPENPPPSAAPVETQVQFSTPIPPPPTATRIIVNAPAGAKADLILYYGAQGLFVRNAAGKPINIKNLTVGRLKTENWMSIAPFPAEKFSADNCLQVGVIGAPEMAKPGACKSVRALITVNATRTFWTQNPFVVTVDGKQLRECQPNAATCEVSLP